jgi:hypothetical protein
MKRAKPAIIVAPNRATSRGSPRSFAAQRKLAQDDKWLGRAAGCRRHAPAVNIEWREGLRESLSLEGENYLVTKSLFDQTQTAGEKPEAERPVGRDYGQAAAAGWHGNEEIELGPESTRLQKK